MLEYHRILALYFEEKPLYPDGTCRRQPGIRKVVEQPWQQTKAEMWEEGTNTLCNLDFIQAKSGAKLTYDLIIDFNTIISVIPDNEANIIEKQNRINRINRYIQDLVSFSKRKIDARQIEFPGSIKILAEEQSDNEIDKIGNGSKYLERLMDFCNFLGMESFNLQNYANEVTNFAIQQAWNFSKNSPVGIAANNYPQDSYYGLFLRPLSSRPERKVKTQLLKALYGHRYFIEAVELTSDGRMAFSRADYDDCILWDVDTGKVLRKLEKTDSNILLTKIKSNGMEVFIVFERSSPILWDLTNGNIIKKFHNYKPSSDITGIDLEREIILEGSDNGTLTLFDLNTGLKLQQLSGHSKRISAILVTPDGRKALTGSADGTSILWDLISGVAITKIAYDNSGFDLLAMTPDGEWALSTGHWDYKCIFWNLATGEPKSILRYESHALSLDITPDAGMAITGYKDGMIKLWDLNNGQPSRTFQGHTNSVSAISVLPDGMMALSGSWDKSCILWDLKQDPENIIHVDRNARVYQVIESSKNEIILFGYRDRTYLVWDHIIANAFDEHFRQRSASSEVSITSDGRKVLSGIMDTFLIIWTIPDDADILLPKVEPEYSEGQYKNPLNKGLRSGSDDRAGFIRNLLAGETLQKLNSITSYRISINVTPDGNRALSISRENNQNFIIWNPRSAKILYTLKGHSDLVDVVKITPDGRKALTGSRVGPCILWDINTGLEILRLNGHSYEVTAIALTPDGKLALTGSADKTCILWDLNSGMPLKMFNEYNSSIVTINFTPDGTMALNGYDDGTWILWNIASGKIINSIRLNKASVSKAIFNFDGTGAFLISGEKTCVLWDFKQNKQLGKAIANSAILELALFSKGIILYCKSGEMILMELSKSLMCVSFPIVTLRRIWDFDLQRIQDAKANCPVCGYSFRPSDSIFSTIGNLTERYSLHSEDRSPCLLFPEEIWDNPELSGICPDCGELLKFNPFFA
jgi:WD40 repeat protein